MSRRRQNGMSRRRWLQYVQMLPRRYAPLYYGALPLVLGCGSSAPTQDAGLDATPDAVEGGEGGTDSPSCAALGDNCSTDLPCCNGICSALAGDPTSTCN